MSPLLANIVLDELDKELERRGHRFCRYADDCNIYVKSQKSGERVMESIKRFITRKLRLKVNETKSKVAKSGECTFLGYTIGIGGKLWIAKKSKERMKKRIKELTRHTQIIRGIIQNALNDCSATRCSATGEQTSNWRQ